MHWCKYGNNNAEKRFEPVFHQCTPTVSSVLDISLHYVWNII